MENSQHDKDLKNFNEYIYQLSRKEEFKDLGFIVEQVLLVHVLTAP